MNRAMPNLQAMRGLPKVFMFSGQGSQYFHMGKPLFDGNSVFRHWLLKMDSVVQDRTSRSVVQALYNPIRNKSEPFDELSLSHPAIFMVEYALALTLIESGVRPDLVLGASLGTFAAAALAGAVSMEDALSAVIDQAAIIESCGTSGGMIAVLADAALFHDLGLSRHCDLAALNFPSHFAVSAPSQNLGAVEQILRQRGLVYQRIPVSYAFHSRWVDSAQAACMQRFRALPASRPEIPFICCAETGEIDSLTPEAWWQVIRKPIDFQATIARLQARGSFTYVDAGPSGTLATFLKYILPADAKPRVHSILGPFGRDAEALAAVTRVLR